MIRYTWNTKKKEKGFEFNVQKLVPRKTPNKIGHYVDTTTIKSGLFKTRARAKGQAQRYVRYYNSKKL